MRGQEELKQKEGKRRKGTVSKSFTLSGIKPELKEDENYVS